MIWSRPVLYLFSFFAAVAMLTACGRQAAPPPSAAPPAGAAEAMESEPDDRRPNILLIVADDMGWTDISRFGSEIETPNLDSLAQQGTSFSSFYASVSCSPTRSMLLSGTDNHLAGLGNMGELITVEQRGKPGYEGHMNDRVVSLAEVLLENGYHTYMAGKWHLGHIPGTTPSARGFERVFSLLNGAASHWSDKHGPLAAHPVADYERDGVMLDKLPKDFYSSKTYTEFLIDAIRENRADGKPFLAYLAFTSPHDPLHVPEPWLSKYRGRYDEGYDTLKTRRAAAAEDLGLVGAGTPDARRFEELAPWDSLGDEEKAIRSRGMEVYAGMVDNMDYHIGRITNYLKDIGEYENTIVIFMSDNGPNPWDMEQYPSVAGSEWFAQFDNSIDNIGNPNSAFAYGLGFGSASSGPLNRFKLTVAEGGIRTPMMIAVPGIKGGSQVDSFVYVWDLMPTILDYANIKFLDDYRGKPVEPMRGRSLAGLIAGKVDSVYGENEIIAGELGNGMWVRQGNYKALSIASPYGDGTWRLYDVVLDPGETNDLSENMPDMLADLKAAWEAYAEEVGVVLMK